MIPLVASLLAAGSGSKSAGGQSSVRLMVGRVGQSASSSGWLAGWLVDLLGFRWLLVGGRALLRMGSAGTPL